ncbi:hypothetical protein [Streptomyces marincola]|uniref:hypothetical protein n=1 Tax=Streptomyces marincola TaxID=2878388 RepID=UPI001CF3D800|nr:hypothetical protein [Streptomyces marincola]UCM89272.1 hypothetical protein LC193_15690 [Streptomyces marincola]
MTDDVSGIVAGINAEEARVIAERMASLAAKMERLEQRLDAALTTPSSREGDPR